MKGENQVEDLLTRKITAWEPEGSGQEGVLGIPGVGRDLDWQAVRYAEATTNAITSTSTSRSTTGAETGYSAHR